MMFPKLSYQSHFYKMYVVYIFKMNSVDVGLFFFFNKIHFGLTVDNCKPVHLDRLSIESKACWRCFCTKCIVFSFGKYHHIVIFFPRYFSFAFGGKFGVERNFFKIIGIGVFFGERVQLLVTLKMSGSFYKKTGVKIKVI